MGIEAPHTLAADKGGGRLPFRGAEDEVVAVSFRQQAGVENLTLCPEQKILDPVVVTERGEFPSQRELLNPVGSQGSVTSGLQDARSDADGGNDAACARMCAAVIDDFQRSLSCNGSLQIVQGLHRTSRSVQDHGIACRGVIERVENGYQPNVK